MQFPWAKIDKQKTGRVTASHAWRAHAADVAETLRTLLGDRIVRSRLAAAGGARDLSPVQTARLAVFAFHHDLGKLNAGFQGHALETEPGRPRPAGHRREIFALLQEPSLQAAFVQAVDFPAMSAWCGGPVAAEDMLVAAFSHHGTPEDPRMDPRVLASATAAWADHRRGARGARPKALRPLAWLAEAGAEAKRLFPEAWGDAPALPCTPRFQDAFCGLLAVADWIASARAFQGEDWFPFDSDGAGRADFSRVRAQEILEKIGMTGGPAGALPASRVTAEAVVGAAPNGLQKTVMDLPLSREGSLALFESETGSGKTEALLIWFLRLYAAGLVGGLYFALPTRTSAVQIHQRITAAMQRLFGLSAPACVLAVPGYLRVDGADGDPAPNFQARWNQDPGARGWPAMQPARYMTAPIVVGTIDQALMSAIAVKHAGTRAAMLSRHLLAIDEVHASDAFMTRLGVELVDRHRGLRGHAALLSATLGAELRGKFFGEPARRLKSALAAPYPAISFAEPGRKRKVFRVPATGRAKTVRLELPEILEYPEKVAELAFDQARRGAKTLVIVNTVDRAIEVQRHLEALCRTRRREDLLFRVEGRPAPHHARFAAEDRKLLDAAAVAAFGRDRPAGGKVLVSTQTMEQSIDIDADVLITDLAPMDVLLQRIGRDHRHDRGDRPRGFKTPKAVVLLPKGDLSRFILHVKYGFGQGAYPDVRVLEATRTLLTGRKRLKLPAENRELVERATHQDALDAIVRRRGQVWAFHQAKVDQARFLHETWGTQALRDVDHGFADHAKPREAVGPVLATRLGLDDGMAVFPAPFAGPFGRPVKQLRVPGWMLPAENATPAQLVHANWKNTGDALFQYGLVDAGGRRSAAFFLYGRLGLRMLPPEELRRLQAPAATDRRPADAPAQPDVRPETAALDDNPWG